MVDRLEPFSWKVDGCRVHRCFPSDDGRYVSYSDYAALLAENERLKVEIKVTEDNLAFAMRTISEIETEAMAMIGAHKGE